MKISNANDVNESENYKRKKIMEKEKWDFYEKEQKIRVPMEIGKNVIRITVKFIYTRLVKGKAKSS